MGRNLPRNDFPLIATFFAAFREYIIAASSKLDYLPRLCGEFLQVIPSTVLLACDIRAHSREGSVFRPHPPLHRLSRPNPPPSEIQLTFVSLLLGCQENEEERVRELRWVCCPFAAAAGVSASSSL